MDTAFLGELTDSLGFERTWSEFSSSKVEDDGQRTALSSTGIVSSARTHQPDKCHGDSTRTDRHSTKRLRATGRQRKYRERLRSERENLLAQVDELSEQLYQMKQDAVTRVVASNLQFPPLNSGWEAALEQQLERLRSEAEYRCLQAAVHKQSIFIKKMIRDRLYFDATASQTSLVSPYGEFQLCNPRFSSI